MGAKVALLAVITAVAVANDAIAPRRASAAEGGEAASDRIVFRTNRGDLVIALYCDIAPKHCAQISKLVRLGVYDSAWFYRIEPNFVAQLTDARNRRLPLTAEQRAALHTIPAEFSHTLTHRRGHVSMARQDRDPNSAESSFSFMLSAAPHLDGKYTIFGELVWGGPVLDAIAATPRDSKNAPRTPIIVESAMVVTAQAFARMREAGELRGPPPGSARSPSPLDGNSSDGTDATLMVGLGLMMALSLLAFVATGKWQPHRVAAFNLLTVLVGAFFVLREYAPRAKDSAAVAIGLFFGIVALFKLMNRFESARPRPAPPPSPDRAPG